MNTSDKIELNFPSKSLTSSVDTVLTCEQHESIESSLNSSTSTFLSRRQIESIKKTLTSLIIKETGKLVDTYKKDGATCEIPSFNKLFEKKSESFTVPGFFGGWYFTIKTVGNKVTVNAQLSSRMDCSCTTYIIDSDGNILHN